MTEFRRLRFQIADWLSGYSLELGFASVLIVPISFTALPNSLWLLFVPFVCVILLFGAARLRYDYNKSTRTGERVSIMNVNDTFLTLKDISGAPTTLQHSEVSKVAFYKRDEITTDLICCEVSYRRKLEEMIIFIHEESEKFDELEQWLQKLPGFNANWRDNVVQPAFAENFTIAYEQKAGN